MRLKTLQNFAKRYGINVERDGHNPRKIYVWTDGSVEDECQNMLEAIDSVRDFIVREGKNESNSPSTVC